MNEGRREGEGKGREMRGEREAGRSPRNFKIKTRRAKRNLNGKASSQNEVTPRSRRKEN